MAVSGPIFGLALSLELQSSSSTITLSIYSETSREYFTPSSVSSLPIAVASPYTASKPEARESDTTLPAMPLTADPLSKAEHLIFASDSPSSLIGSQWG